MLKWLVFCLFLLAPTAVTAKPLTYLVIAQQAEPFQIVDAQHHAIHYSGIITDIVYELAEHHLDISLATEHAPFLRYIRSMHDKDKQPWLSYGSPAWAKVSGVEIQNSNLIATPLFTVKHQLVSLAATELNYRTIDELFGKSVILLTGYSYPGLDQYIESGQINAVTVNSHQSALKALKNRRGIAFVSMGIRSHYTINRYHFNKQDFDFADFSDTIKPNTIHLSHSEDLPQALINKLNAAIISMHQDHKIAQIIAKYTLASKNRTSLEAQQ
ncbi:substrate-binding periplasmic protein [Shewanella waksmanii]|uniref:substrate-binding periplasmic protein n=1 Tax=Shewanella waksmanii TaxID=213783 RepID=UPI003735E2BF